MDLTIRGFQNASLELKMSHVHGKHSKNHCTYIGFGIVGLAQGAWDFSTGMALLTVQGRDKRDLGNHLTDNMGSSRRKIPKALNATTFLALGFYLEGSQRVPFG